MVRFARESWQRDPRIGALVLIGSACVAAFFLLAALTLLTPGFVEFDTAVSAAIRSVRFPGSRTIAIVTSTVGNFWAVATLTAVTAGWLYARHRRLAALVVVIAMAGGSAIGALFKLLFMRARPMIEQALIPLPETYGFPSGHALSSLIYFGCLALIVLSGDASFRRKLIVAVLCAAAALAIALSRVFLGVHYLADVVGAWMLGAAWLSLVTMIAIRWAAGSAEERRAKKRRADGRRA